uniref:Uncharacterized protein n=1 Tax=Sphaerodactylus townsendi TaxID=933632 RepID=A0ACB8F947_9SAUR
MYICSSIYLYTWGERKRKAHVKKLNLLHCMHEHFPIFQAHNATASGSGDTFIKSDLIIYKGSIKLWIFKCIIFRQINKLQQRMNRNTLHSAEHSLCHAHRQPCDSRALGNLWCVRAQQA